MKVWKLLVTLALIFFVSSTTVNANDPLEDEELESSEQAGPLPVPGGDSHRIPTTEELLKMLDSIQGIPEEEKEKLRADLLARKESMSGRVAVEDDYEENYEMPAGYSASIFQSQTIVLFSMLALISSILVFFSYKLYKSLSERERKREEKKKLKQMKKKK